MQGYNGENSTTSCSADYPGGKAEDSNSQAPLTASPRDMHAASVHDVRSDQDGETNDRHTRREEVTVREGEGVRSGQAAN